MQYLFKIDRTKGFRENKRLMGLLANKLLLAFKKDYNKYRRIDNKFKIEQLFRERKGYASRDINVPNTYNEFE